MFCHKTRRGQEFITEILSTGGKVFVNVCGLMLRAKDSKPPCYLCTVLSLKLKNGNFFSRIYFTFGKYLHSIKGNKIDVTMFVPQK